MAPVTPLPKGKLSSKNCVSVLLLKFGRGDVNQDQRGVFLCEAKGSLSRVGRLQHRSVRLDGLGDHQPNAHLQQLTRECLRWVWNVSTEGNLTTSLGGPFQCFATLCEKNFFLMLK